MELKSNEEEKEYRYFDPKLLRPGDSATRTRTPFQVTIMCGVSQNLMVNYICKVGLLSVDEFNPCTLADHPSRKTIDIS